MWICWLSLLTEDFYLLLTTSVWIHPDTHPEKSGRHPENFHNHYSLQFDDLTTILFEHSKPISRKKIPSYQN